MKTLYEVNWHYDDNFHRNVIPAMVCKSCGKAAGSDYRPMGTKYAAHEVI